MSSRNRDRGFLDGRTDSPICSIGLRHSAFPMMSGRKRRPNVTKDAGGDRTHTLLLCSVRSARPCLELLSDPKSGDEASRSGLAANRFERRDAPRIVADGNLGSQPSRGACTLHQSLEIAELHDLAGKSRVLDASPGL